MGEVVVGKLVAGKVADKSLDKLFDRVISAKDDKNFRKACYDLKNELDEMISQVDNIKYGGTFYKYIDSNNIIDKIFGNWLDQNEAYISKESACEDCIEYIKKAGIALNDPDETDIKDYIEKLFTEVEKFCVDNINRGDSIIITKLREIINAQLASQTQTILDNNNENTKEIISHIDKSIDRLTESLKPNDVATLKEISELTKIKLKKRFLDMGLFEEKIDKICPKSMTLEKMYIQPTVKIYTDNELKNGSEDIEIDTLINAFVEHKNKDDFLKKLNIASHNNKIIDNIFKCFEDGEGIFEDQKEKRPYKKILFIYGDAGTGKSTFIYKKCHTNNDNMYVLSMKDISIATDNETLKYEYDYYEDPKIIEFDDIKPNSVLYLDGFDESSNAPNIVQKIYNKTRKYNLKIIITSRIDYKIGGNLESHTMYSQMNFLSNDEILKYVDIYFSHYGIKNTTNYNKYISHIKKAMKVEKNAKSKGETTTDKNDKEFNMYKIPIILYLFSNDIAYESLKNSTELYDFKISSRYGVYKRLFGKQSQIYADRSNRNNENNENNIEDVRTTLKNIAFEMFRQCKLNITIDKNSLDEKTLKNDFGMLFCIDECDRVGAGEFYMEVGGTPTEVSFEFYHKSFYDYFVAEKMADVIVELMKKYNTKEMTEKEKQEIERLLNVYFGLNYITEDIYYFLDEIIKDNYGENDNDLNVIRNKFFEDQINIENEFIKFFREFVGYMCIPANFDDMYIKYGVTRDIMDRVMSNTSSNVTTVLLRVLRQAKIYTDNIELARDYRGINIFGIHEESSLKQVSSISTLMCLKYNEYILRFFTDISFGEASISLDGIELIGNNLSYCNLSNAYLSRANLFNVNLSYANLEEAHLAGSYLNEAYLIGANLESANLSNTNLAGANLRGADLEDAYLVSANLESANLKGANLRGADLRGTNLYYAQLIDTDLRNADVTGAYFKKEQLNNVKILDTDVEKYELTKEELLECGVKIYDKYNNLID